MEEKTKVTGESPVQEPQEMSLAENAFRELKPGEE